MVEELPFEPLLPDNAKWLMLGAAQREIVRGQTTSPNQYKIS